MVELLNVTFYIIKENKMAKGIDLTKYKSLWKTKKALDTVNAEDWQDILKYYWPKTWKPIGKITWKALADRVFSEYCRLFYADDKWYVTCITSGVRMFWKDSQCWHFISRWVLKYRYDIQNCYPQSYAENVMLSWNYKVYTLRMIDMLGKEKVEEMINDKELRTYNQIEYEEMIMERYKFIVEKKKIIDMNHEKIVMQGKDWITKE